MHSISGEETEVIILLMKIKENTSIFVQMQKAEKQTEYKGKPEGIMESGKC